MGPPLYMRSVVDLNVVMRRMTVLILLQSSCGSLVEVGWLISCAGGKVYILLLCAILLSTTWTGGKSQLDVCIHVSMHVDAWTEAPGKLKLGDKDHVRTRVFCVCHCVTGCLVPSVSKEHNSSFGGLGVSALAFGTQVCGFKPGQSRRIFQGEKILSAPSFGREVKPWVLCRWFTACKRSLDVSWKSASRQKLIGHFSPA
jgi:hypothetical protein